MKKILITFLLTASFSTFAFWLDFSLSDFCYQHPMIQDRGGVYYLPNGESGITLTSICVYGDAYGQYQSKGKLINGKLDGKHTTWYLNGQIQTETNYKDGKKDGKETLWMESGHIWMERYFKEGKLEGKQIQWYPNGQKMIEVNRKNDKEDGKWTLWFTDGQVKKERYYKDGECISGDCD